MNLPPFQALIDAHGRDVHRLLIATVGREAADDCYQETWLSALRAYPRLRDATNLRGWVLTIAHRKALDFHRSRARLPVAVAELSGAGASASSAGDLASRAGSTSPAGWTSPPQPNGVWAHVAALPLKQRAAVALRFIADAGYPEISAAMGTSEDAARRNVHEGIKRLRKELGS